MTEKLKCWWSEDRKWFCILVNDGVNQATISLTPSEAGELGAEAIAPPEKSAVTPPIEPEKDREAALYGGHAALWRSNYGPTGGS